MTVEERSLVQQTADNLLEQGQLVTAGSLRILLGEAFSVETLRKWLRHRNRRAKGTTDVFADSHRNIEDCIKDIDKELLLVKHMDRQPFRYVALLLPMLEKIAALEPDAA